MNHRRAWRLRSFLDRRKTSKFESNNANSLLIDRLDRTFLLVDKFYSWDELARWKMSSTNPRDRIFVSFSSCADRRYRAREFLSLRFSFQQDELEKSFLFSKSTRWNEKTVLVSSRFETFLQSPIIHNRSLSVMESRFVAFIDLTSLSNNQGEILVRQEENFQMIIDLFVARPKEKNKVFISTNLFILFENRQKSFARRF